MRYRCDPDRAGADSQRLYSGGGLHFRRKFLRKFEFLLDRGDALIERVVLGGLDGDAAGGRHMVGQDASGGLKWLDDTR